MFPRHREEREVRLRIPATKRWRTVSVDASLEPEIVQRLNDVAFAFGAEVVSTCAGHEEGAAFADGYVDDLAFAELRFAVFFSSWDRLGAQRARICIDLLALAAGGEDTVVATFHERDLDRGTRRPRAHRLGRSLVAVRHARATAEDPESARSWWHRVMERLEARVR